MTKVVLNDVVGGYQSAQATNENYRLIEEGFERCLDSSGGVMTGDLDMNGRRIINQANVIVATAFNWTGPWEPNKVYKVGDVAETNSISYIVIEDHTSNAFVFENDLSKWQLLAGASYPNVISLRWKGEWQPLTNYIVGDVVTNAETQYVCNEVHTSGPTFTGLEWDVFSTQGDPLPDYVPGAGDVLITSGSTVKWGRVTAGNITANSLSAITTVTGTLVVDPSGYVAGGTTTWNSGNGFWLGYHSTTYKMFIGQSAGNKLVYDGTNLTFTGTISASSIVSSSININNKFTVDSAGNTVIKSGTTGARLEIQNNVIKVYDSSGVKRVQIGDLSA